MSDENDPYPNAAFIKSLHAQVVEMKGDVASAAAATQPQWLVVNATTGSFTVTCKTAAGMGVAVAQGGGARVYGDGTNIVLPAEQVGAATQAVQLGQVQQSYAWNHGYQVVSVTGNFTVPCECLLLEVSGMERRRWRCR